MPQRDAPLVVYHYYEKDDLYRDNFIFFLTRAWRSDLVFIVLISGDTSVELPSKPNIRYIRTENSGHDFGSYATVIDDPAFDAHDRFLFVNCTVRGPFLPPYDRQCWTRPFLSLLQGDVHLCGSSINILHDSRPFHQHYQAAHPDDPQPYSHVQSSVHAMTRDCLDMLRHSGFYARLPSLTKDEAVVEAEIGMSQRVKAAGWNLSCVLPAYQGIDYRLAHGEINKATKTGHPQTAGAYFGFSLHPFEPVFVKTGWGGITPEVLEFHSLMALRLPWEDRLTWQDAIDLEQRLAARLSTKYSAGAGKP